MRATVIAVTPGEPAGIGPELCVRLAMQPRDFALVYIADPQVLQTAARAIDATFTYEPWRGRDNAGTGVYVRPAHTARTVVPGRLEPLNAKYVIETLQIAVDGCLSREFDGLV